MTAVGDVDTSLASKCMDFCQALAKQGQAFNFSLTISSGFSFSLDTRRKAGSPVTKKKTSPSTLRRNARRRKEFLAKKEHESSTRISIENSVADLEIKCDQCEYVAATEKGLRQHIRMKHKEPPTEVLRGLGESRGPLECSSPLLSNITREELCQNCEAPFSTGHCCEIHKCDQCGKILSNHDDLSEHEATDHKHVCNHYQCGLSGKKFINHGDVIEHEATFHNNRCDLCNHPSCHGICRLFPK